MDFISQEFAENWPAFLYILMTCVFSIFFLRERRSETHLLKQIGRGLEDSLLARFDRLEQMVRESEANVKPKSRAASAGASGTSDSRFHAD